MELTKKQKSVATSVENDNCFALLAVGRVSGELLQNSHNSPYRLVIWQYFHHAGRQTVRVNLGHDRCSHFQLLYNFAVAPPLSLYS
ncbi:hypothetical protein, partial [Okeania sp. KiyG1]|uniref:hypothetical protein n=1 Tax=Okeania sp. KiyG1 TaxID=2720165 RepID=UPI001924346F